MSRFLNKNRRQQQTERSAVGQLLPALNMFIAGLLRKHALQDKPHTTYTDTSGKKRYRFPAPIVIPVRLYVTDTHTPHTHTHTHPHTHSHTTHSHTHTSTHTLTHTHTHTHTTLTHTHPHTHSHTHTHTPTPRIKSFFSSWQLLSWLKKLSKSLFLCSWARWILSQSISLRSILILSSHLGLCLTSSPSFQVAPPKLCMHFCPHS